MTVIGISGVTGAMGRTLIETASERDGVTVAFGLGRTTASELPTPRYDPAAAATALTDHDPDVVVDFSAPEATVALTDVCIEAGVPLVVGTTGFDDDQLAALDAAGEDIPLLKATNFSRGIQALLRALGPAIETLDDYDVELLETHHNRKRDAPSGTAKTILSTIGRHRPVEPVYGREGIAPRDPAEVGVLVRRAGDVRGEHEVLLAGNDEVLTLSHRTEDRAVFAAGALDAAEWVVDRDPGRYEFADVVREESTDSYPTHDTTTQ